ncbi:vitamin B12 dependent-methionine synthase activation domain-containing protein [Chloroflexota bacterium]
MPAISDQIDIDSQQVLHSIGYDIDSEPSTRLASLLDEYLENTYHLLAPSYSGVIRDIKSIDGCHVVIEGAITFESKVIVQLLEQCHKVAIFLVTIGNHLEETTSQLAEDGLVVQATVLDAIGSVAVESVADFVQERVGEVAHAQGLCMSQRFSPGYCDWNIGQQREIFRAVNGDSAGVHLTEGCLMLPQKSISGIIGIGPYGSNVENYSPCRTCDKLNCLGKR